MEIEPKEIVDISSDRSDTEEGIAEKTAEEVEEIFIKEPKAKPKKKYKLSEAQIEGLRKGREKMREKRRLKFKEELRKELEMEKAEPEEVQQRAAAEERTTQVISKDKSEIRATRNGKQSREEK